MPVGSRQLGDQRSVPAKVQLFIQWSTVHQYYGKDELRGENMKIKIRSLLTFVLAAGLLIASYLAGESTQTVDTIERVQTRP